LGEVPNAITDNNTRRETILNGFMCILLIRFLLQR
jgi:hypothetical protein